MLCILARLVFSAFFSRIVGARIACVTKKAATERGEGMRARRILQGRLIFPVGTRPLHGHPTKCEQSDKRSKVGHAFLFG